MAKKAEQAVTAVAVQKEMCLEGLKACIRRDFSDQIYVSYGLFPAALPVGSKVVCEIDFTVKEDELRNENKTEFILQVLAEREDEFCEESINRISDEVSTSKHDIIAENSIPNEDFRHSLINDTDSSRMQRLDLHQRSFNKWKNWFLNKLVSLECIMKLAPGIIKGVASYHALESLFSQVNFGLFEEHSLRTVRLFIEERIKDPYALLFMKSIGVDLNIEEKAPLYIRHPNILPTLGLYRSVENTYRVTPKHSYTLENILHFSPAVLNDELRIQFVIYQILSALAYSHSQGIAHGDLNPSNIFLANTYWCWLDGFGEYSVQDSGQNLGLSHACSSPQNSFCSQICPCHTLLSELKLSGMDWESSFRNWLEGNLSNFEYLLMLNKLAGRRWGDCAFHTVMPWVIDFSVKPDSASDLGWRDLTKSKWHLAKGDEQLDFTYATSEIPHHVSDECLSELAVCSYKARRLPLHLLRRAVRSVYEPNEYPANMQRLYQWTPDECIPEFYSDPHIFYSIHEGMSDLAVPPWASNPEEFIALHRQALESDRVSRNLHHWIDLTFGYKLSGEAAVAAKNVMLSNTTITSPRSSGRRQLFNKPHPMRKCFKGRFYNACNISNIDAVRTQYKSCSKVDFSSFISPLVDMEEIALFTESARHLSPCYKPMAPVVTEHAELQNVQGSQNRSRKATSQIESTASRESSDQFYFSEAFENGQEKTFQDFLLWESKLSNSSASEAFANDIFSVGCIIAELYLQRPLFDKTSLVFYSKYGVFPGIINRLKPSVRRVVELTLQRDWRRRPSAKELIESPYFSSMVRSAYQFLAPVYLYGKNSSRLEYAASVGRELLALMGYKTAEMCLHSCLPLIMTSEHKEVECAVQLLRAFLEILGPQAARSLLLPSAQKIFQSSESSHLKVSLLQISFVQDLWKACGLDLYLEKIHPLIISNLTTSSQKNSITAASVLLVGSCEDLGVPISVHQTILPIMQYFGRGINFEGIETLIRIGGILGEKMIIRQMFPLLRSIINSCLVSGKADRSEPCHSWHGLAIIDALTVLDGLVRILPTSVMLNELMQEQCNLLVRLLMQTDLSQSVLQHTANSLIAICQHIGPECTSSYILPQLTVLFDKLAISQEADVCLTDLTETAPSSRSGSPQYSQEIYLLYPSLASFLGIEMLRQCCSNWLHLERFLFHEYNWKWDNGMETLKNASDNKFTADVGKDAKHDFNPAKLLLNGVGWSIPQSNKSVVSTVRQTSDNKALANNGILSGNDYDPWFWLPPSSDSWEGLEYLGRFGGIKDDNAWKLKASVLHSVRAHPGTLRAVAVEDNESVVFSAGSGQRMRGMVCRWKLSTMKCDTTYLGHEEVVNDLCILRANERMASCDGTIHIWNSHAGKHIALFSEPSDISSSSLGTSIPSNARDINHGGNGLNVALSGGILSAGFHGSLYSCMQYLKAEDKLVAGTGSGYLRLIDINAGKQLHLWRCEPLETTFTSLISAICSSGLHERGTCKDSFSSSSWIATGFSSGHCRLLDLRSGAINASWHAHDSFITRLAALDSHLLISSSLDKTLRLWDLRSGAPHQLQLFRGLSDGVLSFSIWGHDMLSASGRKIGVTSLSRSHEQPQEQRIAPQNLYTADRGIKNMSVISSVCVLPFSRLFIVGTEDGYLKACC